MTTKQFLAALACCAATAGLIACTDTSEGSSRPDDAANAEQSSSPGVAEARSEVDELRQDPRPLEIPSLAKPAPTGKVMYGVNCKLPECITGAAAFESATTSLGWTYNSLKTDLGPEPYAASWTRAVAAKPDGGINATPLAPESVIAAQLAQAERDNIAVALGSSPLEAGQQGVDGSIAGRPWWNASAEALAAWAVADSNGSGNYVFAFDPSYPLQADAYQAFVDKVKQFTPDASVASIKVDLTEAGNGIPGQIISYLQKNPDTDYVMSVFSTTFLGVSQAIQAAGLKAKVGTAYSQPANFAAVKDGTEAVAIANETGSTAYRITDVLVRIAAGEPVPAELANPTGERQIIDSTNVNQIDVNTVWDPPNYQATFEAAWGVN